MACRSLLFTPCLSRPGLEMPVVPPTTSPVTLRDVARGLATRHAGFEAVVASLRDGHSGTLGGVWGAARAVVAAGLRAAAPANLIVVCPHPSDVDDFVDNYAIFAADEVAILPAWDNEPGERVLHDEIYGDRLGLLKRLASGNGPPVIATSIRSLLQPVPSAAQLAAATRRLAVGDTIDEEEFATWLVECGFHATTAVELPGEIARRGGILDVFAPDWRQPVRIELFGDEIESIRRFSIETQRSQDLLDEVEVTGIQPTIDDREHFPRYLPENAWFILVEPHELEQEGHHYLQRLERPQDFHAVNQVIAEMLRFPSVTAAGIPAGSLETTCHLQLESVERFSGDIARVRKELDDVAADQQVFVVCPTAAEIHRLSELFAETLVARQGHLGFVEGRLHGGFRLIPEGITIVGGNELFAREEQGRTTRRRLGRAIDSFLQLRQGDLVVHLSHGIGRYRGLSVLDKDGVVEEFLELEYHGGTRIYVPASKIELVQKYVGGRKAVPKLARVGGRAWIRQKRAAEAAASDLAAEMIDLQAARQSRPGIAFPPDTPWQHDFDASFPFEETPDQLQAIGAIKADMTRSRPMDRLLCGDVGFGKTELAIRAAFKAIDAGYQVAVLVPTTILAEQHYRTFTGRMAEFPFEVAALSRFCSKRRQTEIIKSLAAGKIDVVVGTHRLAQRDVQFANLGLIIIDEEQRFGVAVKERLKAIRATVDVLTMSATPIPRTLHMSLLGIRDISNLETPPEDRLAVETRVCRFDEDLIRHAILRELNREGQIFFVHNRVHDIDQLAARLQRIVPEARIDVGHGQMAEGQLEEVMLRFIDRQTDVLLATTIIESGLDIPNANTIFIDGADRYGLADLHQLRGRVGRYKHRAYCYLLIDENRQLTPEAARRLRAIEEFSQMGAGFAIAMRDLELRGAGNLIGSEQSGHLAAVGYELYCALLETSVRQQRKLPPKEVVDVSVDLPGTAYLPSSYVPDMRLKIDLYRRIARINQLDAVAEMQVELKDRFGPLPGVVRQLLDLAELRVLAHARQIASIDLEDKYVVFRFSAPRSCRELATERGRQMRLVDPQTIYLPIDPGVISRGELLKTLKPLLQ